MKKTKPKKKITEEDPEILPVVAEPEPVQEEPQIPIAVSPDDEMIKTNMSIKKKKKPKGKKKKKVDMSET